MMARVFDTTFNYKGTPYTAVVTISSGEDEKEILINVHDASLHSVLPGGKIVFTGTHVEEKEGIADADPELIESLREAVKSHENDKPRVSLWS